ACSLNGLNAKEQRCTQDYFERTQENCNPGCIIVQEEQAKNFKVFLEFITKTKRIVCFNQSRKNKQQADQNAYQPEEKVGFLSIVCCHRLLLFTSYISILIS